MNDLRHVRQIIDDVGDLIEAHLVHHEVTDDAFRGAIEEILTAQRAIDAMQPPASSDAVEVAEDIWSLYGPREPSIAVPAIAALITAHLAGVTAAKDAEIARLREPLSYYAEPRNWEQHREKKSYDPDCGEYKVWTPAHDDKGFCARVALATPAATVQERVGEGPSERTNAAEWLLREVLARIPADDKHGMRQRIEQHFLE